MKKNLYSACLFGLSVGTLSSETTQIEPSRFFLEKQRPNYLSLFWC